MAEYISREAAIKYNNTCKRDCATCDFAIEGDSWCKGEIFVVNILEIPAADVAPVIHAHWRDLQEKPDEYGNHLYECSHCMMGDFHDPKTIVPYCWYCGARMDEEVDDD